MRRPADSNYFRVGQGVHEGSRILARHPALRKPADQDIRSQVETQHPHYSPYESPASLHTQRILYLHLLPTPSELPQRFRSGRSRFQDKRSPHAVPSQSSLFLALNNLISPHLPFHQLGSHPEFHDANHLPRYFFNPSIPKSSRSSKVNRSNNLR